MNQKLETMESLVMKTGLISHSGRLTKFYRLIIETFVINDANVLLRWNETTPKKMQRCIETLDDKSWTNAETNTYTAGILMLVCRFASPALVRIEPTLTRPQRHKVCVESVNFFILNVDCYGLFKKKCTMTRFVHSCRLKLTCHRRLITYLFSFFLFNSFSSCFVCFCR